MTMEQFKALHPFTLLSWFILNLAIAFLFQHPVLLLMQMLIMIGIAIACGIGRQLALYLRIGVFMSFLVMLANTLFIHSGQTVLWHSESLPLLGSIEISLEAIVYGAMMSLRLLVVMGLFALYNSLVSPERLVRLMKGKHSHMLVATVLSIRMMPLLLRDVKRVLDVYRCRGVHFETGGLVQRVKALFPLVGVVLQSSLERAFTMAESMAARGYGLKGRTALQREKMGVSDGLFLTVAVVTLMFSMGCKWLHILKFEYYPVVSSIGWALDQTGVQNIASLFILCMGMASPLVLTRRKANERTEH